MSKEAFEQFVSDIAKLTLRVEEQEKEKMKHAKELLDVQEEIQGILTLNQDHLDWFHDQCEKQYNAIRYIGQQTMYKVGADLYKLRSEIEKESSRQGRILRRTFLRWSKARCSNIVRTMVVDRLTHHLPNVDAQTADHADRVMRRPGQGFLFSFGTYFNYEFPGH